MIEAVNATVANAAVLRPATEQVDVARSYASNPERVQESAPQAPYVSPYISWNLDYNKAVLQLRNGDTGEVEREFPSDSVLASRARLASAAAAADTPAPRAETSSPDTRASVAPRAETSTATPAPQQPNVQQANVAQAQVAAAALARSAQAAVPQVATVVTSA